MATPAQIAANRLNALKSTGPTSVEGKAASSCNALKHGLDAASLVIPGEDPAEFAALREQYYAELDPYGPLEASLVQTLILSDWQQRRYRRIESALLGYLMSQRGADPHALAAAYAEAPAGHPLHRVARRLETATRNWFRAHKELRALQGERRTAEAGSATETASQPAPAPAAKPLTTVPSSLPAANWVRSDKPAQPVPRQPADVQPRPRPACFIG